MYTLTLADGTKIENLTMNGTNFVSEIEIDESVFENNLDTMIVSDGETEETWKNVEFIQQKHYENFHGNTGYYLSFREVPENELNITNIELALTEIYEMLL